MDEGTSLGAGRSIDIELGGQEVITIDLDNLDPNPEDVLDLLKEGQCKIWVWTKLAGEYWRRGHLDAAERIGHAAIQSFQANGAIASTPPMYSLLANIQMARARRAPKVVLPDARQDILTEKAKEEYYTEAIQLLNSGERAAAQGSESLGGTLAFLTRGVQQLAARSLDDALRSFEGVLAEKPTNLVALMGKARILYARRNYLQALKLFQQVLQLNPNSLPDPRIGIGLCLWATDHKAKAKAAWQRSLEVNPSEWSAQLLLGLESMNASKAEDQNEQERAQAFLVGTKLLEKAFNANQKSAAAANALCELFLRKGNLKRALKLAERTIQFADTLSLLTEGYIRAARVLHVEGSLPEASKYYSMAMEGQPKHLVGAIGSAQMQMRNDEMAGAIHTLDTLVQPPNPQRSPEAMIMLASLRSHPRPGVSSADFVQEKLKARDLYDRVLKMFELEESKSNGFSPRAVVRLNDMDTHVEVARLWQSDSFERTVRALREALRISEANGPVDPRLLNNLGALEHMEGRLDQAQEFYEKALVSVSGIVAAEGEEMSTSILYNLARLYEEKGDEGLAKEAYEKLLTRHSEYVDGKSMSKLRQAHMLANLNLHNDAHELLKQALSSQNGNLNVRAYYTYFLIQNNLPKPAKDFVFATLKDHDKHDVYSLCAAGWIMYHQSRESRDTSSKGAEERKRGFQRSAEFYEKALQLDPLCAVAAQGLAIITAEDALGSYGSHGAGVQASSGADEAQKRLANARDALDIFAKVRESVNDGSVYLNMGHCYYSRDEFDRAIESYETASVRFYGGHNVSVLLCLCRSWYAKANKDQSFSAMNTALKYAQMALHIQPTDKAVMYNIAMIQQKAAELLFGINSAKRTLKDLELAISQAAHAQKLFASLAADKSPLVPYSRDLADQRRKYGESMLRRGDEHLTAQRQHEVETQAKLEAARQRRQDERDRQEALERERMEELRRQAEILAEERRLAREKALEWTREVQIESDEERERKTKKAARKVKIEGGSGDEGVEPKKKRRIKIKKEAADENEQLFSDEEGDNKPVKKRGVKKRVVRDDDEQDVAGGPRKKQFKSKEMLSDTDDEEMS